MFELSQLSVKFERRLEAEVVQLEILTDDYSKMAFLRNDRNLEFHAQFGTYFKLRIPTVFSAPSFSFLMIFFLFFICLFLFPYIVELTNAFHSLAEIWFITSSPATCTLFQQRMKFTDSIWSKDSL
jgi:hypothetical protein